MKDEIRMCSIELRADDSRQSPGRLYGVLMKYGVRRRRIGRSSSRPAL